MTDPIDEAAEARSLRLRAADQVHGAHASAAATSFAPLVAMGTEILKAVALINGGAGAATILFVAETLRGGRVIGPALVLSLGLFGFGLTVAACATGWSYLSQESYREALLGQDLTWSPPFVADTAASRAARRRADLYRRLGFVAVLVGIGSAVAGFSFAGAAMLS